jgi:MATE family multidrug resistance protein
VFDRAAVLNMAMVNGDIMIRSVLLTAIFTSFILYASDFGDVPLAANQILMQFLHVTAFAMDGFAFAAEALVGQALGAKSKTGLRKSAYMTSQWGLGICIALAVLFAILGPYVIDIMTTSEPVRAQARVYLPYMVAAPILGCAAWMLDGIFIGATRTKDMRDMMILSAMIFFAVVYPLMWALGNHGLWLALLISFVARGASLGWRYPALERSIG